MDIDSTLHDKAACSATALLQADHDLVTELFAQYREAMKSDGNRTALAQEICMQLELHDRIESELIYPAVEARHPMLMAEALEDHADMRTAIEAVRESEGDSALYDGLVLDLMQIVLRHIAREESRVLPYIDREMGGESHALAARIVEFKEAQVGSTEDLESRS